MADENKAMIRRGISTVAEVETAINEKAREKYVDAQDAATLDAAKVYVDDAVAEKVDKAEGKDLMTDEEREKLAGIEADANAYVLPTASANTLGGVKVGDNLVVDAEGRLNAPVGGGSGGGILVLPYVAAEIDGTGVVTNSAAFVAAWGTILSQHLAAPDQYALYMEVDGGGGLMLRIPCTLLNMGGDADMVQWLISGFTVVNIPAGADSSASCKATAMVAVACNTAGEMQSIAMYAFSGLVGPDGQPNFLGGDGGAVVIDLSSIDTPDEAQLKAVVQPAVAKLALSANKQCALVLAGGGYVHATYVIIGAQLLISATGILDITDEPWADTVPMAYYLLKATLQGDTVQSASFQIKDANIPTQAGGGVGQAYPGSTSGEIFNDYTNNKANGICSHAEGSFTNASGNYAHAEGYNSYAGGNNSHAEGSGTYVNAENAHAEGWMSKAKGAQTHAEGNNTTVSGTSSHSEGGSSKATGTASHAEGRSTADGDYSHSARYGTVAANYAQTAIGTSNVLDSAGVGSSFNATKPAFIIGNGTNGSRGDAFRVFFNGNVETDGTYTSPAADYAELFEWVDGNPQTEDRVGRFVTLDGSKIRLAGPDDPYILGVISATPSIIGDNPLAWQGKYANDEWGRPTYEDVEVEYEDMENGEPVMKTRIDKVRKLNPDYNPEQAYTPRLERPEWDAIGMVGKLLVRHDGTLRQGGFCETGPNGIATNAATGHYVMEVIDSIRARIIIK